jgi:hypothetical protein
VFWGKLYYFVYTRKNLHTFHCHGIHSIMLSWSWLI